MLHTFPDRARSSSGRAVDLHSTGKGFESPRVHKEKLRFVQHLLANDLCSPEFFKPLGKLGRAFYRGAPGQANSDQQQNKVPTPHSPEWRDDGPIRQLLAADEEYPIEHEKADG